MKPQGKKLIQQEQEQHTRQSTSAQQRPIEFETAEEAIRFDAAQTEPPASIGARLRDSVAAEPPPTKSWWRRLFRK